MKRIWILVHSFHGIIQEPEIFDTKKTALNRKKELLKITNIEYDEVEIFLKIIN